MGIDTSSMKRFCPPMPEPIEAKRKRWADILLSEGDCERSTNCRNCAAPVDQATNKCNYCGS
jgi:hypothetical protein